MPVLAVDSLAPDFVLQDQDGNAVSRDSLKGKWAVVYFYPKDDTPGCTREACNFRDNFGALKALGADVFGVSGDSGTSHQKFRQKYETEMINRFDTHFFVGNMHQHPGTWIIVGLFYPPRQSQGDLFRS